jgi:general secretion pathway protein N
MAADTLNRAQALFLALSLCLAESAAATESDQWEATPLDLEESVSPVLKAADSPAESPAIRPGNPLWAIPIRALSATRERPLFSPSRRPPPPVVPAAPSPEPAPTPTAIRVAPAEQPPWILVGTIVGEKDKFAFLFNVNSKAVIKLKEGEEEAGWRLREVDFRSTVLKKGGRSIVLELPKPGQPNPAKEAPLGDQL